MMKKLFLCFIAVLACNYIGAQQKVFCELVGTQKLAKSQVTVAVDFGQEGAKNTNWLGGSASSNKLVDENGKPIEFNSMVDAMNFMGSIGWEFEQAYVATMPTMGGSQNVYHWLLSKLINNDDEITDGFTIKAKYKEENIEPTSQEKTGQGSDL